jgi:hypothetical protein
MVAGVVMAAATAVMGATRRRVPCAIASFVTGLGPWWDGFIIVGAAYVLFGFLLIRAGRAAGAQGN